MPFKISGAAGVTVGAGAEAFAPQHVVLKPHSHGSLGHYRSCVRFVMTAVQGANSRLWTIRNTHASNLIVSTRFRIGILSAGTVTAAYRMQLNLFRLTGFTVSDTTNTVTPTVTPKRAGMAAVPGGAAIRHLTVAGNASGMTGGTLTKDGGSAAMFEAWVATAAATTVPLYTELLDDVNGTHPFVLAQNEGLLIEHIVAGSATANVVDVVVDFSWAELAAY